MEEKNGNFCVESEQLFEDVFDVSDPKWGHPCVRANWTPSIGGPDMYSPKITIEQKRILAAEQAKAMEAYNPVFDENCSCEMQKYMVPGCPEEPGVEAEVYAVVPKAIKDKKNKPVLFLIAGGGMVTCNALCGHMKPIIYHAETHKCMVVTTNYRTALTAPYPASVNDLHAAYKWIVDNSGELGVDPDKIILCGVSSGGHLATCLPFRLMRYGYSPRGILTENPITDDRDMYPSNKIINTPWDSKDLHDAYRMWLGINAGSNRLLPEAFANRATVEECIGYPPIFIHTTEYDPDSDANREFYGKVKSARSFAEYHCWGGLGHTGFFLGPELAEEAYNTVVAQNLDSLFKYDFRRPWVVEEHKEKLLKRIENLK